ncbi:MAG: hypothetical protein R2774_02090 [Saprospiraceae bacterium]
MILSRLRSIFSQTQEDPKVQFGRSTSASPDVQIYGDWVKAVSYFENENYLESYKSLLSFLKVGNPSVSFSENENRIQFSLLQGSKIIFGYGTRKKFVAYAQIVLVRSLPYQVGRDLLEANFDLRFCSFGLDAQRCIVLQFQTMAEDGSPYKIFEALEELALEADRQDDILSGYYPDIESINTYHTQKNSSEISKIKFEFLQLKLTDLQRTLGVTEVLKERYPGAMSYVLLDFVYSVDYLIKPEGRLMEQFYSFHDLFFYNNTINVTDKNALILQSILELKDIKFSNFRKELYESQSSFQSIERDSTLNIIDLIEAQQKDLDWYSENNYLLISHAICGYIIGFALYALALKPTEISILQIYYKVLYQKYFTSLGYQCLFFDANNKFKVKQVRRYIKKTCEQSGGAISLQVKKLKSENLEDFPVEFIQMLRTLKSH